MLPNIEKWLKALRSGKYEQTTNRLSDGKGFCCLGVACEISDLGKWDPNTLRYPFVCEGEFVYSLMPKPVQRWLGLKNNYGGFRSPVVVKRGTFTELSTMNDSGFTFNEIAETIESRYDQLIARHLKV